MHTRLPGSCSLRDRYRDQYQDAGPVLRELVEYLFERPYLTVQVAAESLDEQEPP